MSQASEFGSYSLDSTIRIEETDKERAELLDRIDQFWDEGAIADVGDRLREVGLIK
jgi:hypothetical protein